MPKILIITPLYPPDIAPLAMYVKELARRLSTEAKITILAYGTLPEKILNVHIVNISKNKPLPIRLFHFFQALVREARHADYLYVQNGASVELPMLVASFFVRTPIILHLGDSTALTSSKQQWLLRTLTRIMTQKASNIICSEKEDVSWLSQTQTIRRVVTPTVRPEIMPFTPYPTQEFAHYEQSWNSHTQALTDLFQYGKK